MWHVLDARLIGNAHGMSSVQPYAVPWGISVPIVLLPFLFFGGVFLYIDVT